MCSFGIIGGNPRLGVEMMAKKCTRIGPYVVVGVFLGRPLGFLTLGSASPSPSAAPSSNLRFLGGRPRLAGAFAAFAAIAASSSGVLTFGGRPLPRFLGGSVAPEGAVESVGADEGPATALDGWSASAAALVGLGFDVDESGCCLFSSSGGAASSSFSCSSSSESSSRGRFLFGAIV